MHKMQPFEDDPSRFYADAVDAQVGVQNVHGSVYHGSIHHHYPPAVTGSGSSSKRLPWTTKPMLSKTTQQHREQLLAEQRQARFSELRFDEQETRQATIEKALSKTCEWFLGQPEYMQWLNKDGLQGPSRFLWIKGKPGCGKSTLMKFLVANAGQIVDLNLIVVAFFFNARGSDLEKSSFGMYRSLLYQILEKAPDLQIVLDKLSSMTIPALQAAIELAIERLHSRSLFIFVDALDECDEEEVQDLVSFFDDISSDDKKSSINIKICLSSRHYPHVTTTHGVSTVLEHQAQHGQDMMQYVQRYLTIGKSPGELRIKEKLLAKASGVFLWVKLVIKILNRKYRSGRLFELEQLLDSIPSNLLSLYRDILTRDQSDNDDACSRKETAACFQWVLFARRPMTAVELYHAVLIHTMPSFSPWDDSEHTDIEAVRRYILACSKGFLEESKDIYNTVQFIHETARTFFLDGTDLVDLGPPSTLVPRAHACLAECCLSYINHVQYQYFSGLDFNALPDVDSSLLLNARSLTDERLPFLRYAIEYMLRHSDVTQSCGVSQIDFISRCDIRKLVCLYNMLTLTLTKRYEMRNTSLLTLFASRDLPHLTSLYLDKAHSIEIFDGNRISALSVACAKGYEDVLRVLLTPLPHNSALPFLNKTINSAQRFDLETTIACLLDRLDIPADDVFCWAVESDQISVVRCMLNTGKIDINQLSSSGLTPLTTAAASGNQTVCIALLNQHATLNLGANSVTPIYAASANGHLGVIHILYESGADVNLMSASHGTRPSGKVSSHSESIYGHLSSLDPDSYSHPGRQVLRYTALHAASRAGHLDVIRALLNMGADINKHSGQGETPLYLAAKNDQKETVVLLLASNADADATSEACGTALYVASKNGNEGVCSLLIQHGVDVNAQSAYLGTALHVASSLGNTEVVRRLLAASADVNLRSGMGQTTALHEACTKGHADIVQLLIHAKADPDIRNKHGKTTVYLALEASHYEPASTLLRLGAKLYLEDDVHTSGPSEAGAHEQQTGDKMVDQVILKTAASGNIDVFSLLLLQNPLKKRVANKTSIKDELNFLLLQQHRSLSLCRTIIDHGLVLEGCDPAFLSILRATGSCNDHEIFADILDFVIHNEDHLDSITHLLIHTVVHGREKVLRWLIDSGVDVNVADIMGNPLLSVAARKGHANIVIILLQAGVDIDQRSRETQLPAWLEAVSRNDWVIAELLLSRGASLTKSDIERQPLSTIRQRCLVAQYAVKTGHTKILQQMFLAGIHLKKCPHLKEPLVLAGVRHGTNNMVQLLLEMGADPNERDGNTFALLLAVQAGNVTLATLLLEHGARVDQMINAELTALYEAVRLGFYDIVVILLSFGAKPRWDEYARKRELDLSFELGEERIVAALLVSIDNKAEKQSALNRILLRSSYKGLKKTIELSLRYGASLDASDGVGNTALSLAVESGNLSILEILLSHDAETKHETIYGTALRSAANLNEFRMVRLLLNQDVSTMVYAPSTIRQAIDATSNTSIKGMLEDYMQRMEVSKEEP